MQLAKCFVFLIALTASAQRSPNTAGRVPSGVVSTTGPLSPYIDQTQIMPTPGTYSISVQITGTAPVTCTWVFETSPDGSRWFAATQPMTCAAPWVYRQLYGGFLFGRINIVSYTAAADGTTAVSLPYTRGR